MAIPPGAVVIANPSLDVGFGGQITSETGIIVDLDGFDTLEVTFLNGSAGHPAAGSPHPDHPKMYLIGASPTRVEGGKWLTTLTYKGAGPTRTVLSTFPQSLTQAGVKYGYGTVPASEKSWAAGSIEGNINGFLLKNRNVRLNFNGRVVTCTYISSQPVNAGSFTLSTTMFPAFGVVRNPYANVKTVVKNLANNTIITGDPTWNFPAGNVPHIQRCEQVFSGIALYDVSISFVETPVFSH